MRVDDRVDQRRRADPCVAVDALPDLVGQRHVGRLRQRDEVHVRLRARPAPAPRRSRPRAPRTSARVQPPRANGMFGPPLFGNSSSGAVDDVGARVDLGAGRRQRANHVGVILGRRPHQRGLAEPALAGVDVGAARRQQRRTVSTLPVRAAVISTVSPSGVAVLASAPALSSMRTIAALPLVGGQRQRRHAVAVGRGGVRARLQQDGHRLAIVGAHRPVQRRRAVGLGGVDVGLAAEQATHRRRDRRP